MSLSSRIRIDAAITAALWILGAQAVALAQDKPAGELWEQSTTLEMTGMTMPATTLQVCVPPGKADEALSKPQGPVVGGHCSLQDARHEGNKFTAKFMCAGKQAVSGTVETVREGDHVKGTMTLSMNGQQMTMKTDSHKVGTPCTPKAPPSVK